MLSLSFVALAAVAAQPTSGLPVEPKVVMIAIDGVRALELQGKSRDDGGKIVRAESLFPNLFQLKKKGLFLPEMRVSNPVGISLPAYADIFAGRRQEKILSNEPPAEDFHGHYPTIFQAIKKGLGLGPDGVALHAGWEPLCPIAVTPDGGDSNEFYKSCGWKDGKLKGQYFKLEMYKGTRTDTDTFVELARELPKRRPRFTFVHFVDPDEEAHFQEGILLKAGVHYGIHAYHKALREDDYYIGRIWSLLQADPFYKGQTTLIVTTDHGRDDYPDPKQWANHGRCVRKHGQKELCACRQVFGIIVGPRVRPRVVRTNYTHADFAPTIARVLGVTMPTATGRAIAEAFND